MRSDQVQIGKFSVKSDIIQVRYKVYTGLCKRGQGFSDFHGVDLWYLVRKPIINRSRYIEKCQNIKLSKIIADTKWIS